MVKLPSTELIAPSKGHHLFLFCLGSVSKSRRFANSIGDLIASESIFSRVIKSMVSNLLVAAKSVSSGYIIRKYLVLVLVCLLSISFMSIVEGAQDACQEYSAKENEDFW